MKRRPSNYNFEWFPKDNLFIKTKRWFGKSKYFIDTKEVTKEVFVKSRDDSTNKRQTVQYERGVSVNDGGFFGTNAHIPKDG